MLPSLKELMVKATSFNDCYNWSRGLSFFSKVPGMYFYWWSKKGTDPKIAAPHHTPDFYVDDSAMLTGIKSMSILAIDYF